MKLSRIWAGMLTRNVSDGGTDSTITLKIDSGGVERINRTLPYSSEEARSSDDLGTQPDQEKKQANLYDVLVGGTGILPNELDNASVEVGIQGDDAWAPQHFFVWGETAYSRKVYPLAIETDIDTWLSTDPEEGPESLPLRLVGKGDDDMEINRLLILTLTEGTTESGIFTSPNPYFGTEDPFELLVFRDGERVVSHVIPDTSQTDLDSGYANFYFAPVIEPFSKGQLFPDSIVLRILGSDEWVPRRVFIFGIDTPEGRPETMVPLVHLTYWPFGVMIANADGVASVTLPTYHDCAGIGDDLDVKVDRLLAGQKALEKLIKEWGGRDGK